MSGYDPTVLPQDLPVPLDDGAVRHLVGAQLPDLALRATSGSEVWLARERPQPRTVVFAYPRTGHPNETALVEDWDSIPGARGCTPEASGFRDLHGEFVAARVEVFGLSTQDSAYQAEAAERLELPFALLSDTLLRLVRALEPPTFSVAGQTLIKRFTLVVSDARIEHVFYPIFPTDTHAREVLAWLNANPRGAS